MRLADFSARYYPRIENKTPGCGLLSGGSTCGKRKRPRGSMPQAQHYCFTLLYHRCTTSVYIQTAAFSGNYTSCSTANFQLRSVSSAVRAQTGHSTAYDDLLIVDSSAVRTNLLKGRTRYRTSAQSGTFSPGGQHAESTKPGAVTGDRHTAKTVEAKRVRMMATSKSESHIATAGLQPSVRLPKVESDADFNKNNCPKRRGRKRDLRLPPPGGHQNAA